NPPVSVSNTSSFIACSLARVRSHPYCVVMGSGRWDATIIPRHDVTASKSLKDSARDVLEPRIGPRSLGQDLVRTLSCNMGTERDHSDSCWPNRGGLILKKR